MSPGGAIFVPSSPKTGTNLRHPRPPQSLNDSQAQMTAIPVGTVQHCSPISPNPDTPSAVVCFNLENNEGKMGQELEKFESSSADTGLETPGQ